MMHIKPTTQEKMNEAAPSRSPMAKLPEFARIAEKVEKTSGLPFPKSIELIETPPRANLTQSNENTSHSLEIERFVTTKHQNKSTELYTECLHGLGFAYAIKNSDHTTKPKG